MRIRGKWLQVLFLALLLLLAGRIYYIQIHCGPELKTVAQCQQMIPVLQENSSGTIYDRHMYPLTETEKSYYYVIHEKHLTTEAKLLLEEIHAELAGKKDDNYLIYGVKEYWPDADCLLQKQHHAYAFAVSRRCDDNTTAKALVEDLDQMYLSSTERDEPAFYFLGNAAGEMICGKGVADHEDLQTGREVPAALFTTLDLELQKKVEKLFDDNDVSGCAVVADTATGQILAMVSGGEDDLSRNLAVEEDYDLGEISDLLKQLSSASKCSFEDSAGKMGLGTVVFSDYPGEEVGTLSDKKATATAVQVSQLLTVLANQGQMVPLTMILSTVPEETIPCMTMTEKINAKMMKIQESLEEKPLTDASWAVGYEDTYVVVLHLDTGSPRKLYEGIADVL